MGDSSGVLVRSSIDDAFTVWPAAELPLALWVGKGAEARVRCGVFINGSLFNLSSGEVSDFCVVGVELVTGVELALEGWPFTRILG